VNALTQKLDPEGPRVLDAATTRGAACSSMRPERPLPQRAEPTATLLRELREAIPGAHVAGAAGALRVALRSLHSIRRMVT